MRKKFVDGLFFLTCFSIGSCFFNDIPIFMLPILVVVLGVLYTIFHGSFD